MVDIEIRFLYDDWYVAGGVLTLKNRLTNNHFE